MQNPIHLRGKWRLFWAIAFVFPCSGTGATYELLVRSAPPIERQYGNVETLLNQVVDRAQDMLTKACNATNSAPSPAQGVAQNTCKINLSAKYMAGPPLTTADTPVVGQVIVESLFGNRPLTSTKFSRELDLVAEIGWCGGKQGTFLGCTQLGRPRILLAFASGMNDALSLDYVARALAHELGHSLALPDRPIAQPCPAGLALPSFLQFDPDYDQIMFCYVPRPQEPRQLLHLHADEARVYVDP